MRESIKVKQDDFDEALRDAIDDAKTDQARLALERETYIEGRISELESIKREKMLAGNENDNAGKEPSTTANEQGASAASDMPDATPDHSA